MDKNRLIYVLIDRLNVGGVEKTAIKQVIWLRNLGLNVKLAILSRQAVVENAFSDLTDKIPIVYLEDALPEYLRFSFRIRPFAFFSFFHISYAFLIPLFMKKEKPDYIISHGSYTSFTALGIRKIKNIPYSIYFWDPIGYILKRVYSKTSLRPFLYILNLAAARLDKFLVTNSDYIITASTTHDFYFKETCKCKNGKLTVISPGTPLGQPSIAKEKSVIIVTAYKAGKDPSYMLEIAKCLPNVQFKMIGNWLEKNLLETFISKRDAMGLKKTVQILGPANESQLSEYYPAAAVLLTTNLEVGFGMPVLEAAAWGTTSIVPYGSGVCIVFKDRSEAFYTRERNTEEIVGIIRMLTDNLENAKKHGTAAYKKVKQGYTWEEHAKKLNSLLFYQDLQGNDDLG